MENKKTKRRQKNFQVFLQDDEWNRFLEVYNQVKSRLNHQAVPLKKSFVIRRLVGLEPPDELVTQNDIDYFLGRKSVTRRLIRFLPPTETKMTAREIQSVEKQTNDLSEVKD